MVPAYVPVKFPNDAVMAPPAYVRQVQSWARQAFAGAHMPQGLVQIRVLRQDHSLLHFGRSAIETPLQIGREKFAHGLGTHAFSDISVAIPADAVGFEAKVGVDNNYDTAGVRGSVAFIVEIDGEEIVRTPTVKGGEPPVPIVVRLPKGARELRLKVTDGGDGVAYDQADWADAAFVMPDRSLVYLDAGQLDLPIADAEVPFSFTLGGRSSRELLGQWPHESEVSDTAEAMRIRTSWREPSGGMVVTVEARAFKRYPAVEWVLYFENHGTGDSPLLEDVNAMDLRFASGFAALPVTLHHLNGDTCSATSFMPLTTILEAGKPLRWTPTGGRPSSMTAFPFWTAQYANRGLITGIGWTGQWRADFLRSPTGPTTMKAGMERLRTVLHAGERIRTPRMLTMAWEGSLSDAYVRFRRLMFEHFVPKYNGETPIPPLALQCFDRYYSRDGWATEAGQLVYARTAADLGFDSVWLDAAWFPGGFPNGVGNWHAEAQRFPRGLKPVAEAIHEKNMRFVLWFEPERVAAGSEIAKEHPAWVHGGADGGLYKLDDAEARKWLTDLLIRRIREYGVDVYRNDFNIDPLPYWNGAYTPDRQGMTEIRYVEGLYEMWDAIRRECPGIMIDNCASGGRRLDLEMMTRSVPLWRSDTGCSPGHPEWNQMQSMTLGRYLPLFTVGLWSADPYERRSAGTAGAPCEVPYLDSGYDAAAWQAAVKELTDLRKYWFGDLYALTAPGTDAGDVAAWQLHRADLDEGVIYGFRRSECGLGGIVAPIRGVKARQRYRVEHTVDGGKPTVSIMTGKEMQEGIVLRLPRAGCSAIVRYRPAPTSPAPAAKKKA